MYAPSHPHDAAPERQGASPSDLSQVSFPSGLRAPRDRIEDLFFSLSPERIVHYSSALKLPEATAQLLLDGRVDFVRICEAALEDRQWTNNYLNGLDVHTYTTPESKAEFHALTDYTTSPDRLKGDGLLLRKDGEVVGYCLLYRVANELDSSGRVRDDLPDACRFLRDSVDWATFGDYLTSLTGGSRKIDQSQIWHLNDVAVPTPELRSYGLGRLLLALSRDVVVPEGEALVGFIAHNNYSSLLSVTRGGRILGRYHAQDPYDGRDRPAFSSITIMGMEPHFTGNPIGYDKQRDPIEKLPAAIQAAVTRDGGSGLVGHNPATGRLEELVLRSSRLT